MSNTPLTSRYLIGRKLGAGGFGSVYAATDHTTGDQVAIKFYDSPDAGVAALKAGDVRHPNVIPVLETGDHEGTVYLVMPLITGHTLAEHLESGTLSPRQALDLLEGVAAALDALHRGGIVHRDVKPSNIMVTDDPEPRVVLIDVGLAPTVDLDSAGQFMGTPAYAAPEHLTRKSADPAADVYGLAVVLAECLTATRPFSRPTYEETVLAHLKREGPLIQGDDPVSRKLAPVLEKGLALSPEDRYATASDLIDAVRRALDGLPSQLIEQPVGHLRGDESPPTTTRPRKLLSDREPSEWRSL
jgi:serine/threonine protein kinase